MTKRIKRLLLLPLIVAFAVGLAGCVEDTDTAQVTETEETQEETTEAEQTAEVADTRTEVKLTDNYSYFLPVDAEELSDSGSDSGFTNDRMFHINDGTVAVRSFIITGEEAMFPDFVEYLFRNEEDTPGYRTFYDTALAVGHDELKDDEGNVLYRTSYFWPDGGQTLCSLSFVSYTKEDLDCAEKILGTVRNHSSSASEYGDIPPNAESLLEPSEEEWKQSMMEEAKEEMAAAYEQDEGYLDYDTTLGKRGR